MLRRGLAAAAAVLGLAGLCGGCLAPQHSFTLASLVSSPANGTPRDGDNLIYPERLDRGYTLVLPGIVGRATLDHGIVLGLKLADVPTAIDLHDWTQSWLWPVRNLSDFEHNRIEARKIARKIIQYQDRYPGRPVYVVGYSGGGGLAVLTLEALPAGRAVTGVILMAPTLAPDYDLRQAMNHTHLGIANFYSPLDAPILMLMGTAVGTTERRHTIAAGVIGFRAPEHLSPLERRAYLARLPQYQYDFNMLLEGHIGGHFGWVSPPFIAHRVAPLIVVPSTTPAQLAANLWR